MIWVYSAWIAVEVGLVASGRKRLRAFPAFARSWKERRLKTLKLSRRIAALAPSSTTAMGQKAKALAASGVDVVDFSIGEPDFATPGFVGRGRRAGDRGRAHQVHRRRR